LTGYVENVEHTHVAVALCVASGVADVGVGVEAAALQFGLHFIPVVEEDYFLACLDANLGLPAVQRLRSALAGPRWRAILRNLPGYRPARGAGGLLVIEDALPWWRRSTRSAATLPEPVGNPEGNPVGNPEPHGDGFFVS
jgi:putative molybdopterin biosynthesis protein